MSKFTYELLSQFNIDNYITKRNNFILVGNNNQNKYNLINFILNNILSKSNNQIDSINIFI